MSVLMSDQTVLYLVVIRR